MQRINYPRSNSNAKKAVLQTQAGFTGHEGERIERYVYNGEEGKVRDCERYNKLEQRDKGLAAQRPN